MEFNIESLYNQIEPYAEYIGAEPVRNKDGVLKYEIVNYIFDANLFTFYVKYNDKNRTRTFDRVEIKKL